MRRTLLSLSLYDNNHMFHFIRVVEDTDKEMWSIISMYVFPSSELFCLRVGSDRVWPSEPGLVWSVQGLWGALRSFLSCSLFLSHAHNHALTHGAVWTLPVKCSNMTLVIWPRGIQRHLLTLNVTFEYDWSDVDFIPDGCRSEWRSGRRGAPAYLLPIYCGNRAVLWPIQIGWLAGVIKWLWYRCLLGERERWAERWSGGRGGCIPPILLPISVPLHLSLIHNVSSLREMSPQTFTSCCLLH